MYEKERAEDIYDFPSYLGDLENLAELQIKSFRGTEENDWSAIKKLRKLKRLLIGKSTIKNLPKEIGELNNLEEILLERCEGIEDIKVLKNCLKMQVFILKNCGYDNGNLVGDLLELSKLNYICGKFENRERGKLTKQFKSAFISSS